MSTTVRFSLTGHDLSYWDEVANGWVEPDGGYQVYVGDSSALASLPLHGSFTVSQTVGARYATLTAPSTAAPAAAFTASAAFVNDGDYPISGAQYRLGAPDGWQVRTLGPAPGTIAAGQTVTVRFGVTAPESAQGSTATLTARLSSRVRPFSSKKILMQTTASVAVQALADAALSPASLLVAPGKTATLSLTSHAPSTVSVGYTATPPAGITVTPAQGSVALPAPGALVGFSVAVAPGTPAGNIPCRSA